MPDYQIRFNNIVRQASATAERKVKELAAGGVIEPLTLFYKPCSEKADGEIFLASPSNPAPNGFVDAGIGNLGMDVPYQNYFTWVSSRSQRLPLLAPKL